MTDISIYDAAIKLVNKEGCSGAKQYVARVLAGPTTNGEKFWRAVEKVLNSLDSRQTRVALEKHLILMRRRAGE